MISLHLLKLRSAVSRTAVIGQVSLEWPQVPIPWSSTEIFSGGESKFCYTSQVADNAVQTDVHKALYPFCTKRNYSILQQSSQKMHFVGSNSQVYCDKLQNRQSENFETGYFFAKKQIAMVFNKTTIRSFFTQYDLPASLGNKSCKRLRSRPKQSNTISIKPCLSFLTFSR